MSSTRGRSGKGLSGSQMNQAQRWLCVLVIFFVPFASPVYLVATRQSNAPLDFLFAIGLAGLISLFVVMIAASALEPHMLPSVKPRLVKALFANIAFIALDLAIFGVLVYGQ